MEAVFTAAETWPHDGWLIPDLMQIQFPKSFISFFLVLSPSPPFDVSG
jgi:hypothetical protein